MQKFRTSRSQMFYNEQAHFRKQPLVGVLLKSCRIEVSHIFSDLLLTFFYLAKWGVLPLKVISDKFLWPRTAVFKNTIRGLGIPILLGTFNYSSSVYWRWENLFIYNIPTCAGALTCSLSCSSKTGIFMKMSILASKKEHLFKKHSLSDCSYYFI